MGLTGTTLTASPAALVPSIQDFGAAEERTDVWTLEGRVLGDSVAGLLVSFGGLPSLEGRTAVVEDDGWFHLTIQLQPGESGTATAQTTDLAGRRSNLARTLICPTDPDGDGEESSVCQGPGSSSGALQLNTAVSSIDRLGTVSDDTDASYRQETDLAPVLLGRQRGRAFPPASHQLKLSTDGLGLQPAVAGTTERVQQPLAVLLDPGGLPTAA
jgi:hypothetical protein